MAFGALLRNLRRERRWTLAQLAEKIPMSASNLSRLELGTQAPPSEEGIESIAAALSVEAAALLTAAGRPAGGRRSFEEEVLERLDSIDEDVKAVKNAVIRGKPSAS